MTYSVVSCTLASPLGLGRDIGTTLTQMSRSDVTRFVRVATRTPRDETRRLLSDDPFGHLRRLCREIAILDCRPCHDSLSVSFSLAFLPLSWRNLVVLIPDETFRGLEHVHVSGQSIAVSAQDGFHYSRHKFHHVRGDGFTPLLARTHPFLSTLHSGVTSREESHRL
uniref:Uncharacterized protein n=1 Tax=Branchiostoma floridae TaxID=7739 RepID=C3ZJB5_BRAFL|eukprot:XP_002591246.1 hypothetical protein BRAFLDRAFT_76684 [Branchiostoma floridae]